MHGVIVPDSIRNLFADREISAVEGVWQITDGAVLAIVADRSVDGDYAVICVDSPDLRLTPGKMLGVASLGPGDGKNYTMNLFTDITPSGSLKLKRPFDVKIMSDGFMELTARKRLKLNLWAVYRFYFTMSVRGNQAPSGLKARRLYPDPVPTADFPVVL